MSKSKFGDSNLYMTTREFADMVINILDEQNYFKHDDVAHPGDICFAFSTVAETIGKTMEWAIQQERNYKKKAVMNAEDLQKDIPSGGDYDAEYSELKFAKMNNAKL